MFKSESLFCHFYLICNLEYSHTFWNEIISACITAKYMEFDLNDKGEIGTFLKP